MDRESAKDVFPFLHLPRELRDVIYRYALELSPRKLLLATHNPLNWRVPRESSPSCSPSILIINYLHFDDRFPRSRSNPSRFGMPLTEFLHLNRQIRQEYLETLQHLTKDDLRTFEEQWADDHGIFNHPLRVQLSFDVPGLMAAGLEDLISLLLSSYNKKLLSFYRELKVYGKSYDARFRRWGSNSAQDIENIESPHTLIPNPKSITENTFLDSINRLIIRDDLFPAVSRVSRHSKIELASIASKLPNLRYFYPKVNFEGILICLGAPGPRPIRSLNKSRIHVCDESLEDVTIKRILEIPAMATMARLPDPIEVLMKVDWQGDKHDRDDPGQCSVCVPSSEPESHLREKLLEIAHYYRDRRVGLSTLV